MHSLLQAQNKNADRLSFESKVARSTIREVIAGRSDVRILTVDALAKALGYYGAFEFLAELSRNRASADAYRSEESPS